MKYFSNARAISVRGEGRPVGGYALLHRDYLGLKIHNICETQNYAAYKLSLSDYIFNLINIYMSCDLRSRESSSEFLGILGEFQAFLHDLENDGAIFACDFTSDCIVKYCFTLKTLRIGFKCTSEKGVEESKTRGPPVTHIFNT